MLEKRGRKRIELASILLEQCSDLLMRFLDNAPDANDASIYAVSGRMLLEYWFVDHQGKANAPSVNELHEAIYCSVHGASAKE